MLASTRSTARNRYSLKLTSGKSNFMGSCNGKVQKKVLNCVPVSKGCLSCGLCLSSLSSAFLCLALLSAFSLLNAAASLPANLGSCPTNSTAPGRSPSDSSKSSRAKTLGQPKLCAHSWANYIVDPSHVPIAGPGDEVSCTELQGLRMKGIISPKQNWGVLSTWKRNSYGCWWGLKQ